jgi:hypothetical protein
MAGVITGWGIWLSGDTPDAVRFKVARFTEPGKAEIVGQSGYELVKVDRLNTFTTRIPVKLGDVIGFNLYGRSGQKVRCGRQLGGYEAAVDAGDAQRGETTTTTTWSDFELPVFAELEADADLDGYGDETQDDCPTDATTRQPCRDETAPKTRLVHAPPKSTTARRAIFRFKASEKDATFRCSLDGRRFKRCRSPRKVGVKPGRHTFFVFAVDAAGNFDRTPARATWMVRP